ncbi:glycine betaine ABC transporter substrate-binding protein [Zobellella aerophila]|uniref:Glycine betaine ABC transporter substrate-binding protein n=1 Tax=Zobellella aerophila TaxID=870480 RepID=A0ABP6WDE1_9GAMM
MLKDLRTLLLGALALGLSATSALADQLVVGGKNFTEQQLMTAITSQYLEAKGYEVEARAGMGSSVLRSAQLNGQVDLYWEYTGTGLITFNKVSERLGPADTYARVKELDGKVGLVWLNPSKANNTYALAMRRDDAEQRGIKSLSDLAAAVNKGDKLNLAVNAEWYARPDGLKPLQAEYGFKFARKNVKRMDTGLTYVALKEGQVDVALVFATDGRIPAFDFVVLEDDRHYFPAYALTPVVRQETLTANPELAEQLNLLSAQLDDQVMAALNARVDVERVAIEAVAEAFLKERNLI